MTKDSFLFTRPPSPTAADLTKYSRNRIRHELDRQFVDGYVCNAPLFTSFYRCECGHEWFGPSSATYNDHCPVCDDGDIESFKSIEFNLPPNAPEPLKVMTEAQWDELFEPSDLLDTDDEDAVQVDEHSIWTQVDDPAGDGWLVYPGWRFVNRVGYHIARRPWTNPDVVVHMPLAADD